MKMYQEQIDLLQQEKTALLNTNKISEESLSSLEQTIVSLKSMISDKNHEIACLEKNLAIANRKLFLSEEDPSGDTIQALTSRVSELQELVESQNARIQELAHQPASSEVDEESRLSSLEYFVSLVRTLATVQNREEALQLCISGLLCWSIVKMTDNACFHCGRQLSECSTDQDEPGCNYCGILRNLLRDYADLSEGKPSIVDGTVVFLIVFILLSIAFAIIVYNWRNDTLSLALDVKQKVESFIYPCLLSNYFHFIIDEFILCRISPTSQY